MEKQAEITLSVVESFESYVADSKSMGELKARLEDSRNILEPVIRAHKIPLDDMKAWKEKRLIFFPLVQEMEWPREENGEKMEKDNISETELKRMDSRVSAWLGVIKTCLELQILPTDKNADRLRKSRVWTALSGNGKVNPNWVDPKAKKPEPEPDAANTEEAEKQTDALMEKIESQIKKEDGKKLGAIGNALALATMEPASKADTQTTPKVPSVKAATPQKQGETIHPLTSNVSSSDAPISAREHFGILFDQMLKNETFRGEYVEILALMLDVEKATLTRCMVQARDEVKA